MEVRNFWEKLPRPFFVLAPLANVTDAAFRKIIAKYSKPFGPAVMYTEFVSADGLMLANQEGKEKLLRDLKFSNEERPIVAQFFTGKPEMMEKAAALAQELGFDGVDINMGCPDKGVERQGAGAKLILDSSRAADTIEAAKRGAPRLPISVKTRLGYNKDILEEWFPALLKHKPAAIALHARTRKEMSAVPAHWDRVKRAVEIRNELKSDTLVIGNGDVLDIADAKIKAKDSGADGVMLGRAIFGKPWLFDPAGAESARGGVGLPFISPERVDSAEVEKRLQIAIEHTKLFEEILGDIKNFALMKKHFKAYVEGFDGAKELRMKLMETTNASEVEAFIQNFIASR